MMCGSFERKFFYFVMRSTLSFSLSLSLSFERKFHYFVMRSTLFVSLSLSLSFERKFHYFVKHMEQMDTLFEASFSPLTAGGKPWSKCGVTGR
jgi:hypothetical protein